MIVNSYAYAAGGYDADAQAFFTAAGISDSGQKSAVNTLVRENERLRDARAKAENGECLLELTIGMMEQDIATIREIITKGGTAADILKFLDTPNA